MTTDKEVSQSSTATICNPHFNIKIFDRLWPGSILNKKRRRARGPFHKTHNDYEHRADTIKVSLPPLAERYCQTLTLTMIYLREKREAFRARVGAMTY